MKLFLTGLLIATSLLVTSNLQSASHQYEDFTVVVTDVSTSITFTNSINAVIVNNRLLGSTNDTVYFDVNGDGVSTTSDFFVEDSQVFSDNISPNIMSFICDTGETATIRVRGRW